MNRLNVKETIFKLKTTEKITTAITAVIILFLLGLGALPEGDIEKYWQAEDLPGAEQRMDYVTTLTVWISLAPKCGWKVTDEPAKINQFIGKVADDDERRFLTEKYRELSVPGASDFACTEIPAEKLNEARKNIYDQAK